MPSSTQIIPEYNQPYVETHINDNTAYSDNTTTTVDSSIKFLCAFRSSQGIDNVLIPKTSLSSFKKTFGESDYLKYGQPLMMPIAILTAGNATTNCIRVMPPDATFANAFMTLKYKADATAKKFKIKWCASHITSAKSADDLTAEFARLGALTEPDADGFTPVPIFFTRPLGRGDYGNYRRFRVARDTSAEKDYHIKMFNFDVISTTSGFAKLKSYNGAIVTSPKYNQSTLINDVLDDYDKGEAEIAIYVDEYAVEKVYNAFKTFVGGLAEADRGPIPDLDCFDPFFGLPVSSAIVHKNIEIVTTGEAGVVTVDNADGITLTGGSEGSFADDAKRDAAITAAYKAAFDGTADRVILSKNRMPLHVMLDANYPAEVKQTMYELALLRYDALLHLDCGIVPSVAALTTVATDMADYNDRICTIDSCQYYMIRDNITKRKIPVTSTYFTAMNIANHIKVNGMEVPFVKEYATLSGHIKNSVQPAIDVSDMELKEVLYDARVNYFEAIAENVYVRACQNTTQKIDSDLLEENNMRLLLEIKRILEYDCNRKLYNFANAEERKRFKEYEKAKFATWENKKVQSIDIDFQMSDWESQRSILHCYAAVVFKTLNKRTIIEIDVNKRDANS